MKGLIDNEHLNGPLRANLTLRPERIAETIETTEALHDQVGLLCQRWGGAGWPLVPTNGDGLIDALYQERLPGAAIDSVQGLGLDDLRRRPIPAVTGRIEARQEHWAQLAVSLLPRRKGKKRRPLVVVTDLGANDPWRDIYLACLGTLPDVPDPVILRDARYVLDLAWSDFVDFRREHAVGSLDDLMMRLNNLDAISPRRLSMIELAYGSLQSTSIRSEQEVLPDPTFHVRDGGANVVVVCTPGDLRDIALLWNLRTAHGDRYSTPLGIPADQFSTDALRRIVSKGRIELQGISTRYGYVTSASVPLASLEASTHEASPDGRGFGVATPSQLLTFGWAPGWPREEILAWQDGKSNVVPTADPNFERHSFKRHFASTGQWKLDVRVPDHSFPFAQDVRVDGLNTEFFYGGQTVSANARTGDPQQVNWPSPLLSLRAILGERGLTVDASEPGRAGLVVLGGLIDIWEISNLAHAPLLRLLEDMAATGGMSWLKKRARQMGVDEVAIPPMVPSQVDDLPQRSFGQFQRAIGSAAAAKYWLAWAERRGVVVKGFEIRCDACRSRQWTPVGGFSPPIACRGCGRPIEFPFGDRSQVDFRYRLSERTRRLYEHDGIGHLLAIRYFFGLLGASGGSLLGVHPGMEIFQKGKTDAAGEADVLMLFRDGGVVPVEVKRTAASATPAEIAKLETLVDLLGSPWSAVAVCQYAKNVGPEFETYEQRMPAVLRPRFALTYEHLLQPHPFWSLGADPFDVSPLDDDQIAERERNFGKGLADAPALDRETTWAEDWMLKDPYEPPDQN